MVYQTRSQTHSIAELNEIGCQTESPVASNPALVNSAIGDAPAQILTDYETEIKLNAQHFPPDDGSGSDSDDSDFSSDSDSSGDEFINEPIGPNHIFGRGLGFNQFGQIVPASLIHQSTTVN